jgi:hypothetical protein
MSFLISCIFDRMRAIEPNSRALRAFILMSSKNSLPKTSALPSSTAPSIPIIFFMPFPPFFFLLFPPRPEKSEKPSLE